MEKNTTMKLDYCCLKGFYLCSIEIFSRKHFMALIEQMCNIAVSTIFRHEKHLSLSTLEYLTGTSSFTRESFDQWKQTQQSFLATEN